MLESDPEYYQNLEKELKSSRWLGVALIAFAICLGLAFDGGPSAGWPWLLGSLFALGWVIYVRIEYMQTSILMQVYLAAPKN